MLLCLPWFYFCICALHGAFGYSENYLEDRVENLEKKLELMYDFVTKLTTENDDLKARVKALENLAIDGNNFENHPREFSGNSYANKMVFTPGTNNSGNQSDTDMVESSFPELQIKNGFLAERKQIGKLQAVQ